MSFPHGVDPVGQLAEPSGLRISAVHTVVPGRARLNIAGLRRSPMLKRTIETILPRVSSVRRVAASTLTGNVLVFYDVHISSSELIDCLAVVLAEAIAAAPSIESAPKSESMTRHRSVFNRQSPPAGAQLGNALSPASFTERLSWHTRSGDEVLAILQSSAPWGLGHEEVAARLRRFGPNVFPKAQQTSALRLFLSQFVSPPIALLGASAAVAVATGGWLDAMAILGVVAINAIIGFVTESQTQRIIAALDKTAPQPVLAVRGGSRNQIHPEAIVAGDIVLLSPGSRIPADARLLQATRLSIDESGLTGESMPVVKDPRCILPVDTPLADRLNMVYRGTLVTGGSGKAVVIATASDTEMGKIQAMVGEAQAPQTPMERQLGRLGGQLAVFSGAVCGAVFVGGLLRGYGWLIMLKSAVSLAVAAVPEGLPTVATTTLALGIREMRRRRVLIRQLSAVEGLGSIQVLCLDKTGTLTLNRMTIVSLHAGMQQFRIDDGRFLVGGASVLADAQHHLQRLLESGALCSEADLKMAPEGMVLTGSPTEQALVQCALQAGIDVSALRDEYPMLGLQHRSDEQTYMVSEHGTPTGGRWIAVKGSPGQVLALCQWYLVDHERRPLTPTERAAILAQNDAMAGEALRVLGLAYRHEDHGATIESQELCWLGLVGMADPLRPGMVRLLKRIHRAGIQTALITGDQSATAHAIGKQLHVSDGAPLEILDSASLEKLDPEVLAGVVRRVHVFSRVSPAHKLQIVQALQRAGRVVGMTGDGINDGPALKAADLGVAMGKSGTEAARSVADVVLEDDNLNTLVVAIRQGRTVYSNIRKALHFLLATNFTEIEVMAIGIALGAGQPLTPMQLLWINLITDILPGLALALEPPELDTMERPPRAPEAAVITGADLGRLAGESAVITGGTLASFGYALLRYGSGPRASTQAFMTLTLGQLLHALSCRSETHSLLAKDALPANHYLDIGLSGSVLAQLLTVLVPGLRQLLGTTPLALSDGLVAAAGAVGPLLINEAIKKRRTRRAGESAKGSDSRNKEFSP
nr:cation-transporting P-type ATPase [Gammaproteobacteria bacterium]